VPKGRDQSAFLLLARFTKADHTNIIKLLYSALTMKKMDKNAIKVIAGGWPNADCNVPLIDEAG
jgi:hypothetical protein